MQTKFREATQSSEVTPEVSELYCITHEAMVHVEHGVCGIGHKVEARTDEGIEVDFCCFDGGFAYCPPQDKLDDMPEDWAAQPDELSDDERAQAEVAEQGMWLGGME